MTSTNPKSTKLINREDVNEMIENAIRRHNRRSTIISAILGWILIGGYSFGLFHVVPVSYTHLTLPTILLV